MGVYAALTVTLIFAITLTAVIAANRHINISTHWDEMRCSPYVIPIAGFYKPKNDPRSAVEYARANVSFCQKEYIQDALRVAATGAKDMVEEQKAVAALVQDMVSVFADIFADVWNFCQGAYATLKERLGVVSKLFHNMMLNLHGLIDRMQGAILSLIMALISMVVAFVNSVQVTMMVAIIIIGILLVMQILLFFLLMPISGLIMTMSAIASVAVVTAVTIVAAAEVSGGCFTGDTLIATVTGSCQIRSLHVGDKLQDGGVITAIHRFRTSDALYKMGRSIVSGEHLVILPNLTRIPVKNHPSAIPYTACGKVNDLWCLTTTTRTIPTPDGFIYADWEEIYTEDTERLQEWHRAVWHRLNRSPPPQGLKAPDSILQSEAGLSPVCTVRRITFFYGIPISIETVLIDRVQIGDTLEDGPGWCTVIGIVAIAGPEVASSVILEGQQMSAATWIEGDLWKPAGFTKEATDHLHPCRWMHLYTDSGSFTLGSGLKVRDASDVGLPALSSLVESIIL
jgi:hypothetical protein